MMTASLDEQLGRPSYETHKRRILAGLSEAQREWERESGARLVVSQTPPYFSYTTGHVKGPRRAA